MSAGSDAASQRIDGEVFEDPIRFRGVSHWLSATQHWCWARRKDRNSGFWREYESQTRSDSDIESSQPKLHGNGSEVCRTIIVLGQRPIEWPGSAKLTCMGKTQTWAGVCLSILMASSVCAFAYFQTSSLRVLCVAVFLALLWAAYRLHVRQLQHHETTFRDVIEAIPTFAWTARP